jgi:hypothetical protein
MHLLRTAGQICVHLVDSKPVEVQVIKAGVREFGVKHS